MKILVAVAFVAILSALAFAGVAMVRGKEGEGKKRTMMHALAWRVGLSVALFLCILISYKLGWIQPTGIQLH